MRKKVLFIGMLVTLLFAFSGCGTKNEGVVTLIMSDVQEIGRASCRERV